MCQKQFLPPVYSPCCSPISASDSWLGWMHLTKRHIFCWCKHPTIIHWFPPHRHLGTSLSGDYNSVLLIILVLFYPDLRFSVDSFNACQSAEVTPGLINCRNLQSLWIVILPSIKDSEKMFYCRKFISCRRSLNCVSFCTHLTTIWNQTKCSNAFLTLTHTIGVASLIESLSMLSIVLQTYISTFRLCLLH